MTYSPDSVAQGRERLVSLLGALQRDTEELTRMVSVYDDAINMPGRVPEVDDGTGRRATSGPTRPTERTALDESRQALTREFQSDAARMLPYAVAVVRGVIASMDRTLARWEGEEPVHDTGGIRGHDHRAAGDSGADW